MIRNLTFLIVAFFFGLNQSYSQDTIIFTPGTTTSWTVPNCAGAFGLDVFIGGAPGGGPSGGSGAQLNGNIPVNAGDVIDITVGVSGGCPNPVPNGAGTGYASADGTVGWNSCSGGGLTSISINGTLYAVAGAGGGEGGGSVNSSTSNSGGDGGCNTGAAGGNTYGNGGGGGTQTAGGSGGAPWAGTPPGGSNGSYLQGGDGGFWNTASGGGGGAGYYGGGGGGNDGCCTGANGGGGGGGGSSLIPPALTCTQGGNPGPAEVMLIVPFCETTICEGDTAFIDFAPQFPAGNTNFQVTPATGAYQATPGDPNIGFHPADSTTYKVYSTNTMGGTDTVTWPVHVVKQIEPDAGLDDSLCHSTTNGYQLNGSLYNQGNFYWTVGNINTFDGSPGNAIFNPSGNVIDPIGLAVVPGEYEYILHEEDTSGVCPEGLDTVSIYYSVENSTASVTEITCFGYDDGEIDIDSDASAASGNLGAIEYSIDGGTTWQSSDVFTNLGPGTYNVVSSDPFGCTDDTTITLVEPDEIVLSLVSSDTTICQNGTATLVASATGVPAGGWYIYDWDASPDTTASVDVTPSPAGTDFTTDVYAVTNDGCYSDTLSLSVDHYDPISLTITPNDSICPGDDATHIVTPTGGFLDGNPDYTYSWTANGTGIIISDSTIDISPSVNTTYCATVTDACETTPETICTDVIMNTVPQPNFIPDTVSGCEPMEFSFQNATTPLGITDSIFWEINGESFVQELSPTIKIYEPGTYDIWMKVISEQGCEEEALFEDYLTVHELPDPRFTANPNSTSVYFTDVDLNNLTESDDSLTYQWYMPGASPNSSNQDSPSITYPEGIADTYTIKLIATSVHGCVDSTQRYVNVLNDVIIYAPNVFTPDGDQYNESWGIYIDGIDVYDFHLTIFNRWGELIWESYNPTAKWNGHYGDGGMVEDGTYVWSIECKDKFDDRRYEFKGHVTVLK